METYLGLLFILEERGCQLMPIQQLVKLGPISLGQASGLRDIAIGCLEQASQIIALEIPASRFKR